MIDRYDAEDRLGELVADAHAVALALEGVNIEASERYVLSRACRRLKDDIEALRAAIADAPKTGAEIIAAASPGLVEAVDLYTAADPIRHKARMLQIALDASDAEAAIISTCAEVADGLDALLDQIGAAVRGGRVEKIAA
jgi:hypothetical protein